MIKIYVLDNNTNFIDYANVVRQILEDNNYNSDILMQNNQKLIEIIASNPNQIKILIGYYEVQENKVNICKTLDNKKCVKINNMIEQIQSMI